MKNVLLVGGVSLTLRQRLECSIKTVESVVSTIDDEDICPVSPVGKMFLAPQEKAPWMREEKTIKQMLVSCVKVDSMRCE